MTRTDRETAGDNSLESRLLRLEALLDAASPGAADRDRPAPAPGELHPPVLDRLASLAARLQKLTAEIRERTGVCEWDAVDRMAARLAIDQLNAATDDCRTIAAAAAARLDQAERAVADILRELDREQQRAPGTRA